MDFKRKIAPAQLDRGVAGSARKRCWVDVFIFGGLYFAIARLGMAAAYGGTEVTTFVWPAAGVSAAAFLARGTCVWPGIAVAAFAANVTALWGRLPFPMLLLGAGGTAASSTLDAMLAAYFVVRITGTRFPFRRIEHVLVYMLFAALLSMMAGAVLGVGSLCVSGAVPWAEFRMLWRQWWMENAIRVLITAYGILVLLEPDNRKLKWWQAVEAVVLMAAMGAFTWFAFRASFGVPPAMAHGLLSLTIPMTGWAIFRFGRRGAAAALYILAFVSAYNTVRGFGPFAVSAPPHEALFMLQITLGVVAASVLTLLAALAERRDAEDAVRASENTIRGLLNASNDPALLIDANGTVLAINEACARANGKAPAELTGVSVYDLQPPDTVENRRARIEQALRSGEPA
ncbi:MAG: hypothetical protein QG656_2576, partial [Candidatus Hydrogenedentes bacterium]|nr:hypothetical protein [Candidatus Hydrogenedentota bacterium]